MTASEVDWSPLNPARGDASPKAGNLWGDRTTEQASGFLVEFAEGFASPPHIHNVTYRAIVLDGLIHNDDPEAEETWMPAGSFWVQPAGDVHITSASAPRNLAYVEIGSGPYLVKPVEEAFASDDAPLNLLASNLVWESADGVSSAARIAALWQSGERSGSMLELAAGDRLTLASRDGSLHAVVLLGRLELATSGPDDARDLDPGSYIGVEDDAPLGLSCQSTEPCQLYLRSDGGFDLQPSSP